jgi:hypothetical protein
MDIDVGDLRAHYETLMCNPTSLFQHDTLAIEIQNSYTKGRFRQLVKDCRTFVHDVRAVISGLQDDANRKEDHFSKGVNRINDDVNLLNVSEDY